MEVSAMKKVWAIVAATVVLLSGISTASAKTIAEAELQHYQANKKQGYTYSYEYEKQKKEYTTLRFNAEHGAFISTGQGDYANWLDYHVKKNELLVSFYSENTIAYVKAPVKKGRVYTLGDKESAYGISKFEVISINKTVKVKAGTFKDVIVIKNRGYDRVSYLAKDVGLILIKGKKDNYREELVKVTNKGAFYH